MYNFDLLGPRDGFSIPPTVIDPDFNGTITLEIISYRDNKVPIGERFVHIIFAKLASPSEPYSGKYQGQEDITRVIKDSI